MADVTSGSDLTVIILDESEVRQLEVVLDFFAEHNPFPAALLELADALDVDIPGDVEAEDGSLIPACGNPCPDCPDHDGACD